MIRKLKDGRGFMVLRRDEYRIRRRRIFKTEKQAQDYEEKIKSAKKRKGVPRERKKVLTVGEYFQQQIDKGQERVTERKAKIATVAKLTSILKAMPPWLVATPLPKLTTAGCKRYLKHLQRRPQYVRRQHGAHAVQPGTTLSPESAAGMFRTFRGHIKRAFQRHLCPTNPTRDIKIPRKKKSKRDPSREKDVLSVEELKRVLTRMAQTLSPKLYVLFSVLALTGMRGGEARSLRRGDMDLEHPNADTWKIHILRTEVEGVLDRPKTGRTRAVDVSSELRQILLPWLAQLPSQGNPWVFQAEGVLRKTSRRQTRLRATSETSPLASSTLRVAWKRVMKALAGSIPNDLNPHCFRHTYASVLLDRNEEIFYVSGQLGHKKIKETQQTYAKWIHPRSTGAQVALDRDLPLPAVPWEPTQTPLQWPTAGQPARRNRRDAQPGPPPSVPQLSVPCRLPEVPISQQGLPFEWSEPGHQAILRKVSSR